MSDKHGEVITSLRRGLAQMAAQQNARNLLVSLSAHDLGALVETIGDLRRRVACLEAALATTESPKPDSP